MVSEKPQDNRDWIEQRINQLEKVNTLERQPSITSIFTGKKSKLIVEFPRANRIDP